MVQPKCTCRSLAHSWILLYGQNNTKQQFEKCIRSGGGSSGECQKAQAEANRGLLVTFSSQQIALAIVKLILVSLTNLVVVVVVCVCVFVFFFCSEHRRTAQAHLTLSERQ